ncbi:MAG TPA: chorismate mutase [Terriglobales bacterium]|nr:chorismate mutase [Terriglobales bacterium]
MSQTMDGHNNGGKTLEHWRSEIDQLDDVLLRLLNRRAEIAGEIAVIKVASDLPALDAAREARVLSRIATQNTGPLGDQSVRAIFSSIIHETRRLGTERMQELNVGKAQASEPNVRSR